MRRLALALLLLTAPALAAVPAPKPSITSLQQLPIATMRPYDEKADANLLVERAFAKARKSGKRVLIDLGGNWCPDCIVLANFLQVLRHNCAQVGNRLDRTLTAMRVP